MPQVANVYDMDGNLYTHLRASETRIVVPIDKVSKHFLQALVAREDARFYSHPGVDPHGIIRAIVRNITRHRAAEGASTLTQQLAPQQPAAGRQDADAQDPGGVRRRAHRAALHQGADPGALRQPHLLRRRPLRHRDGQPDVLRQAQRGPGPFRGSHDGRPDPQPQPVLAPEQPRRSQPRTRHRARAHGGTGHDLPTAGRKGRARGDRRQQAPRAGQPGQLGAGRGAERAGQPADR